jgi:hypothetical protein
MYTHINSSFSLIKQIASFSCDYCMFAVNNINLFALKLRYNCLNARAAHANA